MRHSTASRRRTRLSAVSLWVAAARAWSCYWRWAAAAPSGFCIGGWVGKPEWSVAWSGCPHSPPYVTTRPQECLSHSGNHHTPRSVQTPIRRLFIEQRKTAWVCAQRGESKNHTDSVSHSRVQVIVSMAGPVSSMEREVTPVGSALPAVRSVLAYVVRACGFPRDRWGKVR